MVGYLYFNFLRVLPIISRIRLISGLYFRGKAISYSATASGQYRSINTPVQRCNGQIKPEIRRTNWSAKYDEAVFELLMIEISRGKNRKISYPNRWVCKRNLIFMPAAQKFNKTWTLISPKKRRQRIMKRKTGRLRKKIKTDACTACKMWSGRNKRLKRTCMAYFGPFYIL